MADAEKLFEALVHEHADMLTAYLYAVVGDPADVEDLFQDTMLVAWRRLDDFDDPGAFGSWLRGIARNLVLNHRRRNARRLCDELVLDRLDFWLERIAAQPGDKWDDKLEALRTCVDSLPAHYKAVIQHRYFKQKSIQQVGESLSVTIATVKKQLQRARSLVLDCMQKKLASVESAQ